MLPKLASLVTIDIVNGHVEDPRIFARFPNLEALCLEVQREHFSPDDILTLLSVAKERQLRVVRLMFPRSFENFYEHKNEALYLGIILENSCKKLCLRVESSSVFGTKFQSFLESLASLPLEDLLIRFDEPFNDAARLLELILGIPTLERLQLELEDSTAKVVFSMLRLILPQIRLKVLTLVAIQRETSWTLTDLSDFNLDLGKFKLKKEDIGMLEAVFKHFELQKLRLAFAGSLEPTVIKAIGGIRTLRHLCLKTNDLQRVPYFPLLLNLETLILDCKVAAINIPKEDFFSKADLDNIIALPSLKYLQTARTPSTCSLRRDFIEEFGRQDVWVFQDCAIVKPRVTLKDILENFSDSEHLKTLTSSQFSVIS